MINNVLIIGGAGNMGRRYQAVLKHLEVPFDIYEPGDSFREKMKDKSGVIICSPTGFHIQHIVKVAVFDKKMPILCEKPIAKNLYALDKLLAECLREKINLQMINQYAHLCDEPPIETDNTFYDYYHSGGDGMQWDCINIIGLDVTGDITLRNESPVWRCKINGWEIDRAAMDGAYVDMVEQWLKNPEPNLSYIEKAHKKAAQWNPL